MYLKNGKVFNTSFCVAYIVLSYIFTLWYGFEFMTFDVEIPSAVIFLIVYIIFVALILWFLKVSNSNIASVIISIFSILYLKEYSIAPIQALVDSIFTTSLGHKPILIFDFSLQIIIVILNLVLLFFAILKLHDQLESKRN